MPQALPAGGFIPPAGKFTNYTQSPPSRVGRVNARREADEAQRAGPWGAGGLGCKASQLPELLPNNRKGSIESL